LAKESISITLAANSSDWTTKSYTANNCSVNTSDGGLIAFHGITSTIGAIASHRLERLVKPTESYSTDAVTTRDFTFNMTCRITSLFPNAVTADTDPAVYIGFAAADYAYLRVAITELGIYAKADGVSGWQLIPDTAGVLDDNLVHSVRFELEDISVAYALRTYIDNVAVGGIIAFAGTLTSSTGQYTDVEVVSTNAQPITEVCAGQISSITLRDALNGMELAPIKSTFTRYRYDETGSTRDVRFYAATNSGLWSEQNASGMWRYAGDLTYPESYVTDFRDSTIVVNYGSGLQTDLVQILNTFEKRLLDDAPNVKFAVAHNNRLWGAGDEKYPLRVYFSGDRAPNLWFSPDTDIDGQETYESVVGAGYFEIDSDAGDRVTAMWGDFKGNLIVATKGNKLFRIGGNSLETWFVEKLDDSTGALGPHCIERVGNDLWIVGDNGIVTLRAVQEFGDLAAQRISLPIQHTFSKIGGKAQILVPRLADKTRLVYEKSADTVHLMLAQPDGEPTLSYVYRLATGVWHGPWTDTYTSVDIGPAIEPILNTLVVGNDIGEVRFQVPTPDVDAEVILESPVMNGRSVDPRLPAMEKTWDNFRLIVNQTGNWPITFRYKVEDKPWQERTYYLARNDSDTIGTDWTVGTSKVHDEEELHSIDFMIGTKGRSLKYQIITTAPALAFVASELEFTAAGFEKGD
jgi:hypothetical protein